MNRIEELRLERGLQQKDLAIDLGVSQPTVSDWETGRKVPSAKSTIKLANYFGVSIDYLLCREGEKEKPATSDGDGQAAGYDDIKDLIKNFGLIPVEHRERFRLVYTAALKAPKEKRELLLDLLDTALKSMGLI